MSHEDWIKMEGLRVGFDAIAIAKADSYPEHEALKSWLAQGFHASMQWMETSATKRLNPREVLPQVKSVITCALNYNTDRPYSTQCSNIDRGWIARYAWGEDYHKVMKKKLKALTVALAGEVPDALCRYYVDTGPMMERVFAKHSGIGWIGKNTCVIDPKLGSWLFLGLILTDLELAPDPVIPDHCGKCSACIDACPTQAITQPYQLDARKCISYLTIEHRGEIEADLAGKMGNHLFGCDICQDVCPWNKKAPATDNSSFQARPGFFNPLLNDFHDNVLKNYPQNFKNSPLKRAKQAGLLRNIEIARSNAKKP